MFSVSLGESFSEYHGGTKKHSDYTEKLETLYAKL
jgi:hypothetical protein